MTPCPKQDRCQRFTYSDGLAVEIAAPAQFTPSSTAAPQGIDRAVLLTVTVVNGTSQPYALNTLISGPMVSSGGESAQQITDIEKLPNSVMTTTVLPGKSATYKEAYAVGAQSGDLQAEWMRGFGADQAIFTGTF